MKYKIGIPFLITLFFHGALRGQSPPEVIAAWNKPAKSNSPVDNTVDAEIIFNRQYVDLDVDFSSLTKIVKKICNHRKIRVNTLNGLTSFNTLYVPLFTDITFKSEITVIKGRTIKQDGTVKEINPEYLRETTIPANVPFLYGYSGKVKLFAFQNLDPGDEVEYYYQIDYHYSVSGDYVDYADEIEPSTSYPVLEAQYSFTLDKKLKFADFPKNCDYHFQMVKGEVKARNLFLLKIANIKPSAEEVYDNDNYSQPSILYRIYNRKDDKTADDWQTVLDDYYLYAKNKSFILGGESISDFYAVAKKGNSIMEKIKLVQAEIIKLVCESPVVLTDVQKNLHPDLFDATQFKKLLEKLNINSTFVFLKNKKNGTIQKNYFSLSQFDDIILEFTDEQNKPHYFSFFKPFLDIDEIDYPYEGTLAMKIKKVGGDDVVEFITLPVKKFTDNVKTLSCEFDLRELTREKLLPVKISANVKGQLASQVRPQAVAMLKDTSLKLFYYIEKYNVLDAYDNARFDSLQVDSVKDKSFKEVNWNYHFAMKNPFIGNKSKNLIFEVDNFSDRNYYLLPDPETSRSKDAYFDFGYEKKATFKIVLPGKFKIQNNSLLITSIDNEVAAFNSEYTVTSPSVIEITYSFRLKTDHIPAAKWNLYADVRNEAYKFFKQKIVALE